MAVAATISLSGGKGEDYLTGGSGNDYFAFNGDKSWGRFNWDGPGKIKDFEDNDSKKGYYDKHKSDDKLVFCKVDLVTPSKIRNTMIG